jgi:hypothetical protein
VRTRDLINVLAADQPISPRPQHALAMATAIASVITGFLLLVLLGTRPDLTTAFTSLRFIVKLTIALTIAVAGIGLTLRLARPDGSPGWWKWSLAAVALFLVAAVASELVAVPTWQWGRQLFGVNWIACLTFIPLLSIPLLSGLIMALRHAAPTDAGLTGAVAGIAAGGIAATIYAAHCPDDSPLFVAAWYSLSIAIVSVCGFAAGRRLLKW